MIVIDASAVVEALLQTPAGRAIEERIFAPSQSLHAPHLLDVEVTHAIRRLAATGEIDDRRGRAAISDLADLPLRRYRHDILLPRAWELRRNFSAYDAVYVALAELLDAPLITRDRRLAGGAGHRAQVEVV